MPGDGDDPANEAANEASLARESVNCFIVLKTAPIVANTDGRSPRFRRTLLLANVALLPCRDWLAP
jgi:hypothetical protein